MEFRNRVRFEQLKYIGESPVRTVGVVCTELSRSYAFTSTKQLLGVQEPFHRVFNRSYAFNTEPVFGVNA